MASDLKSFYVTQSIQHDLRAHSMTNSLGPRNIKMGKTWPLSQLIGYISLKRERYINGSCQCSGARSTMR